MNQDDTNGFYEHLHRLTFMIALRSLYWAIESFEKIGIPLEIIKLYKQAEAIALIDASKFSDFVELDKSSRNMIDCFHSPTEIDNELPSDERQAGRWQNNQSDKEKMGQFVRVCNLFREVVPVLTDSHYDNELFCNLLRQAIVKMTQFLKKEIITNTNITPSMFEFIEKLELSGH